MDTQTKQKIANLRNRGALSSSLEELASPASTDILPILELTAAVAATGTITLDSNPSEGDTITVNGVVFTFLGTAVEDTDVQIGVDVSHTLDNLTGRFNSSADAALTVAGYSSDSVDTITITYGTVGARGNDFTLSTDSDALTLSGSTLEGGANATEVLKKIEYGNVGAPYSVYRALLTQSGTSDPAATVLENTLGGTVVWSRNDVGDYVGNLNGAFLANKIFFTLHHALYSAGVFATRFNDDYVRIIVRDSSGTFVEYNSANPINIAILVYP